MHLWVFVGSVVGFLVGVCAQTFYDFTFEASLWLLVVALGVGLVGRRNSVAISTPNLIFVSLFFLFISIGIIRTEVASWQFDSSPLEASLNETVSLTGVIVREPDSREKSVHLYVETDQDLVLVTTDRMNKFSYGDKVEVSGKLKQPEAFTTDLGRTFDYPGYLRARGVEYKISFAEVSIIESGLGNPIISYLLQAKQNFIQSIQLVIPEPEVGLGSGLLLGVKSALGEDIEQDFRRTGIIHIVVLSGYNVMLVVAFIMFCFSFFLPVRLRIVAGIVAIVCFALVVGLSATVVRASIMASLVLLAQVLGRRYDVLRALFLAGAVMIFINPYLLLYDIGFQLSFMATLGLILIIPHFETMFVQASNLFGLREFFLATVATQIAVLPLLMYHIGEVSLIALVVNMLVLPVVPLAMLLTFLTGVIGLISVPVASLVGFVAMYSLSYILLIAEWFAALPFASVAVPQFSLVGVLLMYGVMGVVWYFYKNRNQETSPYNDWIIETEEAADSFVEETKESAANETETPVFFR